MLCVAPVLCLLVSVLPLHKHSPWFTIAYFLPFVYMNLFPNILRPHSCQCTHHILSVFLHFNTSHTHIQLSLVKFSPFPVLHLFLATLYLILYCFIFFYVIIVWMFKPNRKPGLLVPIMLNQYDLSSLGDFSNFENSIWLLRNSLIKIHFKSQESRQWV